MHDVVVVGGGPAGLRFAQRMAAQGFDTVLLDERGRIGRGKICTGIIGAEAFRTLELPRGAILNQIQRLSFHSPLGSVLDYTHPELLAYVVDRAAFDHSLADQAAAAGARLECGRRVRSLCVDAGEVRVEVERVGDPGSTCPVRARLLVLATGVNSRLNVSVGLGRPEGFLNAAQAHLEVEGLECTHCFAGRDLAPGAFGWLVPLGGGRARVGLMTEARSRRFFGRLLERIEPYRKEGGAVEAHFKPIAQRFRGPSSAHRVIAVGEAAGQVKTTTGGGIYYGLLGADLAAEVAAGALRRDSLEASDLRPYQQLWEQRLGGEIEAGYLYRKAFSRMSDRQIDALFKLAAWNGIVPLVKRKARFDWHLELLGSLVRHAPIRALLGRQLDVVQAPPQPELAADRY